MSFSPAPPSSFAQVPSSFAQVSYVTAQRRATFHWIANWVAGKPAAKIPGRSAPIFWLAGIGPVQPLRTTESSLLAMALVWSYAIGAEPSAARISDETRVGAKR